MRWRPEAPDMLFIATERTSSLRARQYTNSGVRARERSTTNSVDPQATASAFGKNWTKPVLPFSRQGVMRANRVSPFWNFEPLLPMRDSMLAISIKSLARLAIGTNGFSTSRMTGTRGLMSTQSDTDFRSHPSGITPMDDGINLAFL